MKDVEKKLYSGVLKSCPTKKDERDSKKDDNKKDVKDVLNMARKRIGLQPITVEDLDQIAEVKKVRGSKCIRFSMIEFLMEELKMDEKEIADLC